MLKYIEIAKDKINNVIIHWTKCATLLAIIALQAWSYDFHVFFIDAIIWRLCAVFWMSDWLQGAFYRIIALFECGIYFYLHFTHQHGKNAADCILWTLFHTIAIQLLNELKQITTYDNSPFDYRPSTKRDNFYENSFILFGRKHDLNFDRWLSFNNYPGYFFY